MTRIVTTHYRYKPPPPRTRKAVPLPGPAVVTRRAKTLEAKPVVTAPPPANDDRKPAPLPTDGKKSAIVTASPKRVAFDAAHLPMELPLSRKPVEREGDDYKRLKAAMARRLRGDDE